MSDAYAAPRPWAGGSASRADRGPHQHQHGQERRQKRANRSEGRREAFLAAKALRAAMSADGGEPIEDMRRGRRSGGPRGRGGPFGRPGGGGRGRGRARRGDVRAAILTLLAEEPRNGYGVIQEIEERSNGVWKPSPGAVYPALQQLEDEGLVRPVEIDGRKLFELTDGGRTHVETTLKDAPAPWASVAEEAGTGYRDGKQQFGQLWHAYAAVHQDGTPEQIAAATKVLGDARKSLYRILAEDDESVSDQ